MKAFAAVLLLGAQVMPAQVPAFEVASIERSDPKEVGQFVQFPPGGRFTARNCMVSSLIQAIYGLKDYQLVDGPKWIGDWNYRYNIDAKAAGAASTDQVRLMAQELLVERFRFRAHREMRDLPVYSLMAAKGGSKLQNSEGPGRSGIELVAEGVRRGHNVTMDDLVQMLTRTAGRPVVDKTGFNAPFDFRLEWAENTLRGDDGRPSIFVALQEQMGLRLEAGKGPVEVMVVDQVERPSAN